MNTTTHEPVNKKTLTTYWVLLLLGVLFIGPLVAAWSFYESGERWVPGTINWGHLITPPVPLSKLALSSPDGLQISGRRLNGKWLMLYIEPKQCDKTCRQTLYKMRQVRLALGDNMERVERVIATPRKHTHSLDRLIQRKYLGTLHLILQKEQMAQAKLPQAQQTLAKGGLYLVDPLGNIMMYYNVEQGPKGIYDDMRRLLKASHIG
jgi:cytochrome oxidase Cu insertion factor (SCO1/SenC/PrrC family)